MAPGSRVLGLTPTRISTKPSRTCSHEQGHADIVRLLALDHKADLRKVTDDGSTCLHLATKQVWTEERAAVNHAVTNSQRRPHLHAAHLASALCLALSPWLCLAHNWA